MGNLNKATNRDLVMSSDVGYQSIFRDEGWVLGRFHGWRPIHIAERLQVWLKGFGPLLRYQVMLDHWSQLTDARLSGIWSPSSQVIVKVFGESCIDALDQVAIHGRCLGLATDSERLFNKFTFVVDLNQDEDALWGNFNQTTRKQCRVAQERGVVVSSTNDANDGGLNNFLVMLSDMSCKRGLRVSDRAIIRSMVESGAARLHRSSLNGVDLSYALVYRVGEKIYYLYGISSDEDRGVGGGQLLHWEVIKLYRAIGVRWYDLGGVPEVNTLNGIYKFKRGFGGQLIDLGSEYVWTGSFFKLVINARRCLKVLRGGSL